MKHQKADPLIEIDKSLSGLIFGLFKEVEARRHEIFVDN